MTQGIGRFYVERLVFFFISFAKWELNTILRLQIVYVILNELLGSTCVLKHCFERTSLPLTEALY